MGVDSTKYYGISVRRDTDTNWLGANPVLSLGELGIDTTYNTLKIGNGISDWGNLDYVNAIYPDNSLIAKLDEFLDPGYGIDMTYYSGEKVYEISATGLANSGDLANLSGDISSLSGMVDANATGIASLDDRMDDVEDDIEILDIKVSGIEARSSFDIEYIIRSPQGSEVYGDAPPPSACYVGLNGSVVTNPVTINEIFLSFIDKNGLAHNFVSVASGDTMNFREENSQAVAVRFRIDAATQLASGVKLDVTMQSATASGTVDDGDIYDCLFFPDVDVSDKADIEYVDQLFGLSALKGSANTFTAKNTFQDHIILDGDRRITAKFGDVGILAYGTNDVSKGVRMQWGNSNIKMQSKLQLYSGKDYSGSTVTPQIDCRGYNIVDAGKFNTTVDRTRHPTDNFNAFILKGKTDAGENQTIFKDFHQKGNETQNSWCGYYGRTDIDVTIQTKASVEALINTSVANFVTTNTTQTISGSKTFTSKVTLDSTVSVDFKGRIHINGSNGATGQVLTSQGQSNNPIWSDPPSSFSPGDQVVKSSTGYTSGSFYKSGNTLYWVP